MLGEAPHDFLNPSVDVLLLGKPGEVDVVEEGDGYPGGMCQRRSGSSSCTSTDGVRLQSPNTPTQLASIAAAIPAVERSWLMAPMGGTPFSLLSLPRSVAPSPDTAPPPNG